MDLDGLARLFTSPGLSGEFAPSSYFQCVELVWTPVPPAPAETSLHQIFQAVVDELCGDASTIAVSLSGGLDSLAVLIHVLALRPRRRVLAFVVELIDDCGVSAVASVRRLLGEFAITGQVHLSAVDPGSCTMVPAWSPYGPRPDAMPVVNATVAGLAAQAGADILLSGDGADELLAVPRFAAIDMLRRFGVRGARWYLRDATLAGPGVLGELLGVASLMLPMALRTRIYWAANWPEWSPPTVSPVLAAPFREAALAWARQWVDASIEDHVAARRSWAAADAFDCWWPRAYRHSADHLPEASPFLHPDMVAAALALPLSARYDPAYPTGYLRAKAQVVELFPSRLRHCLLQRKRLYRTALADSVSGSCNIPIASAIGLLDPDALARDSDTATRMMAIAVERWLAGVIAAGITVQS